MTFNQVQTDGISELFVTPFLRRHYPDSEPLNRRLQEIVLERERMSPPPSAMSNVGGWQSKRHDLLDWPYPEMATLRNWIVEAVKEMTGYTFGGRPLRASGKLQIFSWANVLRRGNFNRIHNHPGTSWSGVYYVAVGGEPVSETDGVIEFVDPRGAANMIVTPGRPFDQKVRIRPRAGDLILFPSFLQHFVNPYESEGTRISIAFNVSMQHLRLDEVLAAAQEPAAST